jgi:eukaryotic-like serine/threonine-protein kinase
MNNNRWHSVERIFDETLELPERDRAAFLAQACDGDQTLQREVESLLAAHYKANGFLVASAAKCASATNTTTVTAQQRIGPYQLLCEIAQGGMGTVWLAARADDQYQQQVAIKLLKAESSAPHIAERLRYERQILADLNHPNIARLLDGGTTESGQPYIVMEYIAGMPIDEYCRAHQLTLCERLQLFRQVCAAVEYAHQHLIIHRDLKPANILVTADGTPKLLDFGIAKLLQADPKQIAQTRTGQTPMTPAYASPEQVRNEKLTTTSDVYALGVVLYELLTGRSPYQLKNNTFSEMMRAICEQEPTRPSFVTKSEAASQKSEGKKKRGQLSTSDFRLLTSLLKGDLDSIVLMALRKEPTARYSSVEQFSADIRRYLDGLPTLARKGTFAYRAVKYVRRYKVPVAAATLILLSLIGGVGATSRQAQIARAEQAKAEAERIRAEQALAVADEQRRRAEQALAEVEAQRTRAETALTTAEQRRKQADAARNEANQQRAAAETQRLAAEAERNVAQTQRQRAEAQELSNRRLLYASQMALANTAWNEANVERVQELLTAQIPQPGEPDLRGFEWDYLWSISHTEVATWKNSSLQPSQGSIAFSSDDRQFLTVTKSGVFQFLDASTGQQKASLTGDRFGYSMVPAISSDQKLIASIVQGSEKEIGIWEAATGKLFKSFLLTKLEFESRFVRSFAFSPDHRLLAVGSYLGHILILDTQTGKEVLNFHGHRQQVNSLAYSPDGGNLLSGSYDGRVKLWDVRTGKELMTSNKPAIWMAVAYSPDGQYFGAGGSNGTVVIWDARMIQEVKTLTTGTYTKSLVFSPDGRKLATGGDDLRIRIWDTQSWTEQGVINGHGNSVSALAFAPQGDLLVSGSVEGTIKVWDLRKGQTPLVYCGVKPGANEVIFSRNSSQIILGSPSQYLTVRDIATGREAYTRQAHILNEKLTGHPFHTLLTSDGQTLITAGDNGMAFWDFNTGQELRRIAAGQTSGIALSPDNRLLATSGRTTGPLQIWDVQTGREMLKLKAGHLNSMVFLSDSQTLATGFDQLLFMDVRTGQINTRHDLNGEVIFYLKLSPDQRTLAVGTNRGLVSLHDATTGRKLVTLKGHSGAINGMAFSPDGKRLASSSSDGIRLWDVTTEQEIFVIRQSNAGRLAFSPDGKHLAAVSGGKFKLYSTAAMELVPASCQ